MTKKTIIVAAVLLLAAALFVGAVSADGGVAKIGDVEYATLYAAFTAANDGDTITLLQNAEGVGLPTVENKWSTQGVVLDLGGFTYTVTNNAVGSEGTETQGLQALKGNKLTIKNGMFTSTSGSGVKMLIQNYCDLTLDGVNLDGTKLDDPAWGKYVMSNNCGNTAIKGSTSITAASDGVAFDVYFWPDGSYTTPPTVTVDTTGIITGKIEVARDASTTELPSTSTSKLLLIEKATVKGDITLDSKIPNVNFAAVEIRKGSFTSDIGKFVPEQYKDNVNYVTGGSSDVKYEGSLLYTVTIPALFDFGSNEALKSGVAIDILVAADSKQVVMSVNSDHQYKLYLDDISSDFDAPYKIGTAINADDVSTSIDPFFTVSAASSGKSPKDLFFVLSDGKPKKAGTYTDKLTFTTEVVPA